MIQLRPYESRDARTIISWIGDEVAFRKWCADRYEDYPITAYDIDRQYASADPDRFFPMTAFDETGIVGHLIMRYTDEEKHILRFGFIIIDDKRRGQGIGGQMLKAAIRYAFEVLQANRSRWVYSKTIHPLITVTGLSDFATLRQITQSTITSLMRIGNALNWNYTELYKRKETEQ